MNTGSVLLGHELNARHLVEYGRGLSTIWDESLINAMEVFIEKCMFHHAKN